LRRFHLRHLTLSASTKKVRQHKKIPRRRWAGEGQSCVPGLKLRQKLTVAETTTREDEIEAPSWT
jgi:hypothetical protein